MLNKLRPAFLVSYKAKKTIPMASEAMPMSLWALEIVILAKPKV